MPEVTVVIPTMGERMAYLENAIASIRRAGQAHILVVGPENKKAALQSLDIDQFELDPRQGLVAAINIGFEKMPKDTQFANWLGDDDELTPDSLSVTSKALRENPEAPFVFGGCGYVDDTGTQLWINKSGKWAIPLLRFGPDLVPQPGALIRVEYLRQVLPIDNSYKFAFDFDMFLRLSKLGQPIFLDNQLANFRWHQDSLTVSQRKQSANEASVVRKSHLPKAIRIVSELWEAPVRFATNVLGAKMLARQIRKLETNS